MSVLIFVDHADGHIKKAAYEAFTYGADIASRLNIPAEGLLLGTVNDDLEALGKYGISKLHQVRNENLDHVDGQVYAKAVEEAAIVTGAKIIVFSHNQTGKAVAPRAAVRLKAGIV